MLNKYLLALTCCTVLLVACGDTGQTSSTETATRTQPAAPAAHPARTGVVETEAGAYTFNPTRCAIYKEDGVDDIEISGPGSGADGGKIFVDFSSTANALEIALGVDTQFASADRKIRAGQYVTEPMDIEVDGRIIRVAQLVLEDDAGQRLNGSLEVDCR